MKYLAAGLIVLCLLACLIMIGCGDNDADRQARLHAEKIANIWMAAAITVGAAGIAVGIKGESIPAEVKQVGKWVLIAGAGALILVVGLGVVTALLNAIVQFVSAVIGFAICGLVGWLVISSMGRKR